MESFLRLIFVVESLRNVAEDLRHGGSTRSAFRTLVALQKGTQSDLNLAGFVRRLEDDLRQYA